jgi:hypothetical protein
MARTMKTVGPTLLLALAIIAGGCGAVATDAPEPASGNAYPDAKPFTLMGKVIRPDDEDHNMLVNLSLQVSEPVLSAADPRDVRRAVSVTMVTYYAATLANFGGTLELVDTATDDPILAYGGGADPGEAMASARIMLGQDEAYEARDKRPRYEVTIRPLPGLTWGTVASPDDISVTWEPFVPTR